MSDQQEGKSKFNNSLPIWGNESSMNLNPLILTNIQSSTYFKVSLFKLKTYHEVIDEIYYQCKHMEPWEMGSRKLSGQTGMCGGVRGVGAGGIVSSFFCLLYKMYTLRLTRKQLNGLLNHTDSPYIRALGFMYIRYTQPPADLYNWYEEYLLDEEEIDVKAGGGQVMTIGQVLVHFLTKLDWLGTLFPRIPVPIQKQIQAKLEQYAQDYGTTLAEMTAPDVSTKQQKQRYGPGGDPGDNRGRNKSFDNRNQRGEGNSYGRNGSGGGAFHKRDDEGRSAKNYSDDRYNAPSSSSYSSSSTNTAATASQYRSSSKYSRSRSRSRSPRAHKYYDKERAGGSDRRHKRRSPSEEDRYESYRRGGDRDRDMDNYYPERDRESYRSSSSSHKRRY